MSPSAKSRRGAAGASIDAAEVARFAAMADEWWAAGGKFAPLHRMNPARLAYVRDRLAVHFGRDPFAERPLAG
ncbi:MAG TPA: bifunctional 3-demethylubiquinol 3-O-methyltransferase/2-polyprenyl-6-hydroxyphenol methylase, partial [Kiloniellales bacterium]